MTLLNLLVAPLAGKIGGVRGAKTPLVFGCVVAGFGLVLLSFSHGSELEIVLWAGLLGLGIGAAFAAMPNLIIEAVEPHETGEATGVNTIMRNVGASLGSQVCASILAGHVSGGAPVEHGFEVAFLLSAVVALVAAGAASAIPRRLEARAATATPAVAA
jgi:MFS family permease